MGVWRRIKAIFKPPVKRRARLGYDGARQARETADWIAGGSGANTEISGALRTLRNRCSDLARNNPYASKAVESLVSNVISTGIRAKWADPRVQALWDQWTRELSVGDDLDFYGLQALAFRGMVERGDVVARRRWRRPDDGLTVPLQVEILEGDFIDEGKVAGGLSGGRVVQGVEFDVIGRRSAYWLFRQHPGESGYWTANGAVQSSPVAAADVAHLYQARRPGQVRGVPWLSVVIDALRQLGEYQRSERIRKRSQAGLVGVLIPADDATYDDDDTDAIGPTATDADGNTVDELTPNSVFVARKGKDFRFTSPSSDAGFADTVRVQLHAIASGVLLPYEVLSSDLSQVNYSSIRLGLVEAQRIFKMLQLHVVIPLFCAKIAGWFVEAGQASGAIPAGADLSLSWVLPEREEIDRETAVKSAIARIRAGLSSRRDEVAATGGDAGEVLAEIVADLEALDAAGITLDTDPRHPASGPVAAPQEAA